jgi:hypothetical protein
MALMSGGTAEQGYRNLLQGDFGESWLEVVASAAGLLHGRPVGDGCATKASPSLIDWGSSDDPRGLGG